MRWVIGVVAFGGGVLAGLLIAAVLDIQGAEERRLEAELLASEARVSSVRKELAAERDRIAPLSKGVGLSHSDIRDLYDDGVEVEREEERDFVQFSSAKAGLTTQALGPSGDVWKVTCFLRDDGSDESIVGVALVNAMINQVAPTEWDDPRAWLLEALKTPSGTSALHFEGNVCVQVSRIKTLYVFVIRRNPEVIDEAIRAALHQRGSDSM